jgi:hypothetical protein
MFSHFEYPGKCEWLGGGLNEFTRHYNEQSGTAYSRTQCLDITKLSGMTPKAPEVLLTDSVTGKQMVIERKSIVWPPNYIHRHQLEHQFAESIWEKTRGLYRDAAYELSLDSREFDVLDRKDIQAGGNKIAEIISHLDPRDLPLHSSRPIKWSFRKVQPHEEGDQRTGIIVSHQRSMMFEDTDDADARTGTSSEMKVQLAAAAAKFEGYLDCRRLVLLDFYGTDLCEDDIPLLLEGIAVPTIIDEVWRTVRDWISADDYQIGYDRLYNR